MFMSAPVHHNFLSQFIVDNSKEMPRRKTKLACTAYYMKKGIRGYNAQKVMLTELSVSDCRVTCTLVEAIEGHLYLVIDGWPAKFACVVKKRYQDDLEIRFITNLPEELVEKLTTSRF
jgi:hypothetical protein